MSERIVSVDVAQLGRELGSFRLKDADRVGTLSGAIRLTGDLPPLQVGQIGQRLMLIDGFKRLEAAVRAGLDRVPAAILETDRPRALVLLAQLNQHGEGLSALEEGWIIAELHQHYGQTLQRIAAVFGRDHSWAVRREQLVLRLAPEVQQLLRQGGLDPAAAEELVFVPRGTQPLVARRAAEAHLSVGQIRAIVRLVLQAPDEPHRRYVIDHPRQVLHLIGRRVPGSDRWSELEILLELLLREGRPPDPASAQRLGALLDKLKTFLEVLYESRTCGAGAGVALAGRPDPTNLPPAQAGA